tara:strand:+ start:820 stop:2790 length:1971 start_codon:yes stop_codon:yes gene_type:complete
LDYKYDREPTKKADRAAYWNNEILNARKFEENWRERASGIVQRYRDDNVNRFERESRMNIFHSNVDTLKSALYFKTPKPRVTRRFKTDDPVGKSIAMVMERALQYQLDVYDFDSAVKKAIEDMLIVGRGAIRMRYDPVLVEGEPERIAVQVEPIVGIGEVAPGQMGEVQVGQRLLDPEGNEVQQEDVKQDVRGMFIEGKPVEYIGEQSIRCEYVHWDDLTIAPARCWEDVKWIAFRHLLTRQDLIDYYGTKGEQIPLTYRQSQMSDYQDNPEPDMAEVYEIWDKRSGKQIFVATSFNEILEDIDDPYNLEGFWPMPEPLYSISTSDTTLPVPEIFIYEDQLFELDLITQRIAALTEALKRRGVYDASFQELVRLADANDNEFIPVENFAMLQAGGGLANVMQEAPLDNLIRAITALYQSRQIVIDTIYEITGISDIMRGTSASRETATAQRIKGQFGAMRLTNRQRSIEKFLDKIMTLKAELLVENLEPSLLERMTAIAVPPAMVAVMRDDRLRSYRVSIDTDESSAIDASMDQKNRTDFLTAMVQFLQTVGPLVSSGTLGFDQAKMMMLFAARAFPGARELEESLEAIEQPQPQANPADKLVEVEGAKVQAQTEQAKADTQVKIARLELDKQKTQADIALKEQKLEIDAAKIITG